MPYPTTRALNERLTERKTPSKTVAQRKAKSFMLSPPLSPRKALKEVKQSKLPVRTSPTSTLVAPVTSPKKLPGPSKSPVTPLKSPPASNFESSRPQTKKADDSWLKKKDDNCHGGETPRTPSEVKAIHARKRSRTMPTQSRIPKQALALPQPKHSELPDTLLRRHVLAPEPLDSAKSNVTSKDTSTSSLSKQSPEDIPSPLHSNPINTSATPQLTSPKASKAAPEPPKLLTEPAKAAESSKGADPSGIRPSQARAGSTCKPKGHPYTSHFIPYMCEPCVAASQERERDRRQRLEASLAEDGLIERVKLQEWQWRAKFNAQQDPKQDAHEDDAVQTAASGGTAQPAECDRNQITTKAADDSLSPTALIEQKRLKEEAEMLVKMEEANRQLEEAMDAKRRRSAGDSSTQKTRQSWVLGLRRSWGSESKVEVEGDGYTRGKGRASWRVSRWTGREEY